jgi:hypothetical protein
MTAARMTVIATMRMTPITGDTASSPFKPNTSYLKKPGSICSALIRECMKNYAGQCGISICRASMPCTDGLH